MPNAFVTGGTGFVGLNLIAELTSLGWTVTALHRPTSDLTYLKRFPVRPAVGSITDPAALAAAIPRDVDVVFHVAGNTNQWSRQNDEQTRDNVDGTANVVQAALQAGAKRLIHTSSISAYGDIAGTLEETTPSTAARSWINYQRTKWLGEEKVRQGISQGLPAVIMNPGGILGPYDLNSWARLFMLIDKGGLPGIPPGTTSFAHAHEVAKAHIAAAERGKVGENYLLAGTDASYLDLFTTIGQVMQKPIPKRVLPAAFLRLYARFDTALAAFKGKPPTLTPEMAASTTGRLSVPSIKAQRELGFRIVPLEVMVKDCYDWLVAEGKLKRA